MSQQGFYNYHNLKDLLGDGIFAVDGVRWRHQRKLSSYEFSANNLRDFSGDVFRKAAAKLAAAISNSARSTKAMDIQVKITKQCSGIVSKMLGLLERLVVLFCCRICS